MVAAVLAFTRRPFRRDLALLALLLPLGVVAQAVLGGFTVREHLAPGFVMAHFSLSMIDPGRRGRAGVAGTYEPGRAAAVRPTGSVWSVRALLPLGALTIFAGTAATAAGPHSGGFAGQHVHRLHFKGADTLTWVDAPARDDRRDVRRRGDRGLAPAPPPRRLDRRSSSR